MRTDRRTGMMKLIAIRNFANASKKHFVEGVRVYECECECESVCESMCESV